jgi:hypothetical protein
MRTQVEEIVVLSRADNFRRKAEACALEAEQATDRVDGQLWLLMAKQWAQLAQYVAGRPDDS